MTVFTPDSEQEVARILCTANGSGFEPTGSNRTARTPCRSVLSAEALSGIVHHDPADRTITVRAGTRLEDLSNHLRNYSQRLSFDHPAAMQSGRALTVGAAVALNLRSSRRPFSGSVRDAVLGTRFVSGLGEVVATGARVLKNAAGLDLSKALAGSRGHLGFLTEVTFRVLPLSTREQTGMFLNVAARNFPAHVADMMKDGRDVTGAALLSKRVAAWLGLDAGNCMIIRLASGFGLEDRSDASLHPARVLPEALATSLWADIASGRSLALPGHGTYGLIACKASTGGAIAGMFEETGANLALDWRGALVWVSLDRIDDRAVLKTVLQDFPDAALRWQSPPHQAPLDASIRRLKAALDPLNRFKPATSNSHLQI